MSIENRVHIEYVTNELAHRVDTSEALSSAKSIVRSLYSWDLIGRAARTVALLRVDGGVMSVGVETDSSDSARVAVALVSEKENIPMRHIESRASNEVAARLSHDERPLLLVRLSKSGGSLEVEDVSKREYD